ncbi:MAG: prolipoprotein diacylglyceryl transferase [Treponema sp.]|jgi:phosphatidylglycerol:prolipoprotein diacylglycerol transferase|nr:prolipoprotein diacylglyceryl transferase [Treponema sp.]
MLLSVNFPSWLKPEIIPGLPVRWYGLMYIFAFGTAFLLYRRQVRERKFPMSEDDLSALFGWGIFGLLAGARIFSTLIYDPSGYYRLRPWLIFWPFRDGRFTGLVGMSYHGGAFAGLLAVIIFAKAKRFSFREIGDMFAASIPLGYTFGRLGNFFNAELYGRVTAGPLGMVFPEATRLPASEAWVREAAGKAGIAVNGAFVNLPRYPTQLFEAFFEGVVLWAIIWFFRNRKPFKGFLVGLYFLGYGVFRFFLEYFREADEDLGYRIELIKNNLSPAFAHPPLSFSTGQILSFLMIVFGIVWLLIASRLPGRNPQRVYGKDGGGSPEGLANRAARKKHRRTRKKLR